MGFWTTLAVTAASAGSTYMKSVADANDQKAQAALSDHAADISLRDAEATDRKTQFDQVRSAQEWVRRISTLTARLKGKSGAIGKTVDQVMDAQEFENALDTALIGVAGRTQSSRLESQAAGQRAAAEAGRRRARQSLLSGLVSAGTDVFGKVTTASDLGMFKDSPGFLQSSRNPFSRAAKTARASRKNRKAWDEHLRYARSRGLTG